MISRLLAALLFFHSATFRAGMPAHWCESVRSQLEVRGRRFLRKCSSGMQLDQCGERAVRAAVRAPAVSSTAKQYEHVQVSHRMDIRNPAKTELYERPFPAPPQQLRPLMCAQPLICDA